MLHTKEVAAKEFENLIYEDDRQCKEEDQQPLIQAQRYNAEHLQGKTTHIAC